MLQVMKHCVCHDIFLKGGEEHTSSNSGVFSSRSSPSPCQCLNHTMRTRLPSCLTDLPKQLTLQFRSRFAPGRKIYSINCCLEIEKKTAPPAEPIVWPWRLRSCSTCTPVSSFSRRLAYPHRLAPSPELVHFLSIDTKRKRASRFACITSPIF